MTRAPKPWHFFFLVLPYGAAFGFVSVALPYVARQRGISVAAIGGIIAASLVPHSLKVLWAPVVDVFWLRKGWYALPLAFVCAGTWASMAMPIVPASWPALTAIVVATQFATTFLGMACEGLIGHGIALDEQGIAAGWFQAGSYLGLGVGGGAAMTLVERFGGATAGLVIGLGLAPCALPLLGFDEPRPAERRPLREALLDFGRDLMGLVRSKGGIAALFICFSPIGSGAASNLFAAIADEWHASLELVALTTGTLGGVVSAVGAACGGWIAARMNRRTAYALGGALTAVMAIAMATAPHVPWAYGVLTLAYQAMNGVAFAAFSAFAFEVAGKGAIATKYNVLASLANWSIVYMIKIDSAAHARWGGGGLLWVDAAMTGVGIVGLVVLGRVTKRA